MRDTGYFSFTDASVHLSEGIILFHYELDAGGVTRHFTDELLFDPGRVRPEVKVSDGTLMRMLRALHLVLGISYWKTYAPADIRTPLYNLTTVEAQFWNSLYTKGLGEFFYTNGIDYRGLVQFPCVEASSPGVEGVHVPDRSLVLVGGGKDSIVSGELLKEIGHEFALFAVNPNEIHKKTASVMGQELIPLERKIDPALFGLNKKAGVYNGHVPVSSMFALCGVLVAYLYGYSTVIASNEQSASYGNVEYFGETINHQWSKSYEFETLFSSFLDDYVEEGITYFSLLRPLTELHITRYFVSHPEYFPVFTSCNKAFRISSEKPKGNWCGTCPKCAFVYLLLAAHLPKQTLYTVFHKNMFEDVSLIPLYEELCGISGFKPFECVGTPEESIEAFRSVLTDNSYVGDTVVQALMTHIPAMKLGAFNPDMFSKSVEHRIPPRFSKSLDPI